MTANSPASDLPCSSAWTPRRTLAAGFAVILFWAAAASMWLLTDSVVPWDSKNHFYPMLRYLGASLANGEWPLWNPYHFSGFPAVADPQSLLFTPTMLLFGWLVPTPSMHLFDLVVLAHFLPGAAGVLGLFRRRGWHPAGAVVAAMIYILGGSAAARLQHTGMIFSYGFFPLALLFLESALARRSYLRGVLFAVTAALMAVGRDQVAFLCCLTLIGAGLHQTFSSGAPLAFLRSRLPLLAVMAATGAVILAVPALLTIQLLMESNRPAIGFGVAAMGSLPPSSLATLLFGNVFGSLDTTYDYWGPGPSTLAEGSWTDRAVNYLFVGTPPALLLLWHGIAGGRLFARDFRFFLIVGLTALVYALGRYTPVFELLFDHVPGVDLYRRPADATFLINFAVAMAVGYLVHRYLRHGLPGRPTARGAVSGALLTSAAIALAIAAVAAGASFAVTAGELARAARDMGLGLALAVLAAAVLVQGARRPAWRTAAACLFVLGTGVELVGRNAASALNAEPAQRYAVFEELPAEQLRGLQILKTELDGRHARGERPRIEILGLGGAWQNASMVFGLEDTIGYNPLRLADYERAVGPGENAADPNLRHFPGTFRGYRCRLATLLGLEYLVLDRPIERLPRHFPRLTNANLLYGAGSMWIYRLTPTAPRAYLATRLIAVDSESVLQEDELPEFDRNGEALIDEADAEELRGDYGLRDQTTAPEPATGQVRIRGYRRNAVVIDVETDRRAMLVLHDIYYPGWEAVVDGESRPIRRVNLLFRGVEVPPGRHRVHFTFRPLSVNNLVAAMSDLIAREENGVALQTRTR
ncbi:YfhO family protein [Chelatococcus sp. SYSU_G07232]|uniref:YfhO family protein n=1 Tax=Chelatococcus albus TaxID=3047466 RepID=A0ABT7AJ35_9HYPH|nr:YfhO family protein [Chelatococcus sp. SYSU_G07232]MDJ1159379.1 YfhO family protein [Chelatococcus sp. SYSU_G07232]